MPFIHRHKDMEDAGFDRHSHNTVDEAKDCERGWDEYLDADAAAEAEMEARAERYFEEGPESFQAARFAEEQYELRMLGA